MWTPAPFLTSSQSSGGHLHPSRPQASRLVDTCGTPFPQHLVEPCCIYVPLKQSSGGQLFGGHLSIWWTPIVVLPCQPIIWIQFSGGHRHSSCPLITGWAVISWTPVVVLSRHQSPGGHNYLVDAGSHTYPSSVIWWTQLFGGWLRYSCGRL